MTPHSVIIDTDPGLDDAIAILFALAHPGLDIRGVTTVAGNIGLSVTTRNALRLLALAGRAEIPVYPGAPTPLRGEGLNEERIHGADGLGGVSLPEPVSAPQTLPATDYMARALSEAPAGSLDIFALGPLTNIARLVQDAPEAAARIGRLFVMGGAIDEHGNVGPRSEFNLAHDPEAARIVLGAGVPLTLVPLDVTRRVRTDGAWLDRLGDSTRARTVRALIEAYFAESRESRPLHDPCVPVLAVAPELFGIETLRLAVDMQDDPGALVPGGTAVDVAMHVDAAGVLDRLAERLG